MEVGPSHRDPGWSCHKNAQRPWTEGRKPSCDQKRGLGLGPGPSFPSSCHRQPGWPALSPAPAGALLEVSPHQPCCWRVGCKGRLGSRSRQGKSPEWLTPARSCAEEARGPRPHLPALAPPRTYPTPRSPSEPFLAWRRLEERQKGLGGKMQGQSFPK